ncbi:MAG: HK97 gp10 family phage protein [Clostridiales bacterium]|nr:HK97 gp10 family phage protein [Clostridiales bacterium]
MGVSLTGFDSFLSTIENSPDELGRKTALKAAKLAEQIAGQARAGAPVDSGRLRNSLESYVETHGDTVEGGVKSSYPPAIYHELGTGPVGAASGHPMAGEMGVNYSPDGWVYWSDEVAAQRGTDAEGQENGFVYTQGVPAKAFMHNALTASEDAILEQLGAGITEVLEK